MQGLRLELRQSQQLVMTPQLQQAIRLLQMSNLELSAYVADETEKNPLLSRDDGTGEAEAPREAEPAGLPGEDPGAVDRALDGGAENVYDAPLPERPAAAGPSGSGAAGMGAGEALPDAGERAGSGPTLREALIAQIGQLKAPPMDRAVALCIVDALEEDGYLREPMEEIGARLDIAHADLEAGLALVQGCEPTGVGARSLAECMALQLAERGRLDPMMQALIDRLDLLATGNLRRLCAAIGATEEDLADMLADLRRLDPRPGHAFAPEPVAPRVPDVLLSRGRDGGWEIVLNPETLPRVSMDRHFAVSLDAAGAETDRWIAERRAEAQWLIRSVEKRANTILSVTREIVRAQSGFFEIGPAGLRPLTLRRVADEAGLHESTVSRVASNKLIQTPRGLYEMKFFFSNAVGEDQDLAAETVRQRVKAVIEAEAGDAVLSDDDVVDKLRSEGIAIARRTVAKYRKLLKIPSSVERRRRRALA
ncbi:MAG: RNA polymerase factor sigma-54 [Pseudomonadota bacterium]